MWKGDKRYLFDPTDDSPWQSLGYTAVLATAGSSSQKPDSFAVTYNVYVGTEKGHSPGSSRNNVSATFMLHGRVVPQEEQEEQEEEEEEGEVSRGAAACA